MRIQLDSGTPAELVLPAGEALRGLVVIPDIMGLRPLFDDLVARLAAENRYAVAAIELFPTGPHLETVEERFEAAPHLDDQRVIGDTVAAADVLQAQAGCDYVAVLGFCMGGMYALKAAASGRFDKAVSFYGMIRVPSGWRGPGQAEPLELLKDSTTPILAVIGGRDPYTPASDVEQLRALGPHVEAVVYAEAEHGFVHDRSRPAHRADDAADAWARVFALLAG
jgi:dienelactone hydrolase